MGMKKPEERKLCHPKDPHFIPCRRNHCIHLKVPMNQFPCNKCSVESFKYFREDLGKQRIEDIHFDIRDIPEDFLVNQ